MAGRFRSPQSARGEHRAGLNEYLVINGSARVTEGGAAELLQELARTYLGLTSASRPWTTPRPATSPTSPWTESQA